MINNQNYLPKEFAWQKGGGTFSISYTHVPALKRYIQNQKEHHKATTFKEEYLQVLKNNEIDIKDEFLPEFFD